MKRRWHARDTKAGDPRKAKTSTNHPMLSSARQTSTPRTARVSIINDRRGFEMEARFENLLRHPELNSEIASMAGSAVKQRIYRAEQVRALSSP
jgi:hypothetical protein